MVAFPVYAQESEQAKQDIYSQEQATPDLGIDKDTKKVKIINNPSESKLDNSDREHSVDDDLIYQGE